MKTRCTHAGCVRPATLLRFCTVHYTAAWRAGLVKQAPAVLVRRHLMRLRTAGWATHQIAAASTVHRATVEKICLGRYKFVKPATARLLLGIAVSAPPGATRIGIDSVGVCRRLQALACLGWSVPAVAARGGMAVSALYNVLSSGRPVSEAYRRRVIAIYDELWDTPGPSSRAAAIARHRGYPPPQAWDDTTIDNPAARPRGVLEAAS